MAKKVMAFGSFDLLHPGHLDYIERAARLGDHLIVVIARDSSIRENTAALAGWRRARPAKSAISSDSWPARDSSSMTPKQPADEMA